MYQQQAQYQEDYYDDDDYYEQDYQAPRGPMAGSYQMPDEVPKFIFSLYKAIHERNVTEIQTLYENSFAQLTEMYFKDEAWPDENEIAPMVEGRPQCKEFMVLYKELYFRHVYAKCQPTIDQRFDSYYNYCSLFNILVSAKQPVQIDLPNQWLWDIIDEFIYQFQSYSLFRMRSGSGKHSDQSMMKLKENPKIWNVHSVLNVLHSLVDKSQINQQLQLLSQGRDPSLVADEFGRTNLYKVLGYFSLIGLLRLHSLLGDYYQAIKVLENVDIHRAGMTHNITMRVLACQMATFYYVGFAYMMMRRYADAIRTLTSLLVYLQRTRQMYHQIRTFQVDMIDKQTDQMYVLLNICLVLHPQRIDESIASVLHEKYSDSMGKMQRGELDEFENLFRFACPKFLSPVAAIIDFEMPGQTKLEPWRQQLKVFIDEVKQHLPILNIRSFLRLYTTMPMTKLSNFLGMSEEDLRTQLLSYKNKMQSVVWQSGNSGLEGEFQSGSDVDFYIDSGMVHVADTKVARRYGDYFIRQIHKFEEQYRAVATMHRK